MRLKPDEKELVILSRMARGDKLSIDPDDESEAILSKDGNEERYVSNKTLQSLLEGKWIAQKENGYILTREGSKVVEDRYYKRDRIPPRLQ